MLPFPVQGGCKFRTGSDSNVCSRTTGLGTRGDQIYLLGNTHGSELPTRNNPEWDPSQGIRSFVESWKTFPTWLARRGPVSLEVGQGDEVVMQDCTAAGFAPRGAMRRKWRVVTWRRLAVVVRTHNPEFANGHSFLRRFRPSLRSWGSRVRIAPGSPSFRIVTRFDFFLGAVFRCRIPHPGSRLRRRRAKGGCSSTGSPLPRPQPTLKYALRSYLTPMPT
jgi:hypothetical protein